MAREQRESLANFRASTRTAALQTVYRNPCLTSGGAAWVLVGSSESFNLPQRVDGGLSWKLLLLIPFFKKCKIHLFISCVSVSPAYMYVHRVCTWCPRTSERRGVGFLELELQTVVSCHVAVGN